MSKIPVNQLDRDKTSSHYNAGGKETPDVARAKLSHKQHVGYIHSKRIEVTR